MVEEVDLLFVARIILLVDQLVLQILKVLLIFYVMVLLLLNHHHKDYQFLLLLWLEDSMLDLIDQHLIYL